MKLLTLSSLFLIFSINLLISQENNIKFEQIYEEEGLSNGNVTYILQDKKGFMWFATWNGLNRFDGYSTKVYKFNSSDPGSISDDFIICMHEDSEGTLWIGTFDGGLNKYNRETDSFTSYKKSSHGLPANQVSSILEDSSGTFWISTINKLNKFDRVKEKCTLVKEFKPKASIEMIEYPKGILWLGTFGDGLYKYEPKTGSTIQYKHNKLNKNSLAYDCILGMRKASDQKLWVATYGGGLDLLDIRTGNFTHYKHDKNNSNSLPGNQLLSIAKDYKKNIWIGLDDNGVAKFDPVENKFVNYKKSGISGIHVNSVKNIYESKDHSIWLGTYGKGVYKSNLNRKPFIHYQHNPDDPGTINGNQCRAFFEEENGILWVSVYQHGLNRIDRNSHTNYIFKYDPNDPYSISNNSTWSFYEDQSGTLWIGTMNGLCKFNKKTKKFYRYLYNEDIINNTPVQIWRMLEDKQGIFWLATMGKGLYKFDRESGEYKVYENIPGERTSILHNNVLAIYEDSKGLLWVGTDEGLEIFDRKSETFTHFVNNPNNPESISDNDIISINEDSNGNLWFGTEGGGLNMLNREKMTFTKYTENDGLANNVVLAIIEENASENKEVQNLWLSTHSGLSKFNPKNRTFRNYDVTDGLQSNSFSINSYFQSKSGEIFFGGYNGFTAFYPDSIKENKNAPNVVITALKIFNVPVKIGQKISNNIILTKAIEETEKITLTYKESVFSFDFSALHYVAPEKNKYAYFLEGFSENWICTKSDRRFATFTNLDPGTYTFTVKASNNDDVWNQTGTSIEIEILPPFWKTLWFRIIAISLVLLSLYLWYLRRINVMKKQKAVLEQQVKERTHEIVEKNEELKQQKEEIEAQRDALEDANATKDKFFTIISHDLKSPFNALLGFSELMAENYLSISKEKGMGYIRQIYTSSKQLFELVENLLSWSRTKTGNITSCPEYIDMHEIANNNKEALRLILNKKNISIINNIPNHSIVYADPNLTSTVLRNLISNAIKFSMENGQIILDAKSNKGFIEVSVTDSGLGISKENINKLFRENIHFTTKGTNKEKGTGLGLILCEEFVKINGGKIWVKSIPEKGSTFYFTLPVEKNNT